MSFHLTGLALVDFCRTGAQWLYALLLLQTPTFLTSLALVFEVVFLVLIINARLHQGTCHQTQARPECSSLFILVILEETSKKAVVNGHHVVVNATFFGGNFSYLRTEEQRWN